MVAIIHNKIENYFTDPKYGKPPVLRTIPELIELGIINLDKPANPSSHEVTAWVKQILNIKKAGHGGTLDPAVTGCLPIALGRGTRALQVLLPSGKEYICVMKTHAVISTEKLNDVLNNFRGKIFQTPPIRSSVKRRLRVRRIYKLELLEHYSGQLSLLRISCQAGTYIRKLCHDIGLLIGTGAHMQELRRVRTGPFTEESLVTLQDLNDAWYYYQKEHDEAPIRQIIKPIEVICSDVPKIYIRDSAINAICHGAALTIPGVIRLSSGIEKGNLVAIFSMKDELVGLAYSTLSTKQILEETNGICANSKAILMQKDTYPSSWKKNKK
ncbi:MAG: RNA-guided pseudouridylation complex pseudouridine synthase subunit Cbf5 [Candidatus Heimdallarchaeota archaeon]|nr:RNA-guided pseudouridylation complex pseudouridine synthase subunit Cbf5 [Candidatus Heimdallarchaeota archaeon]